MELLHLYPIESNGVRTAIALVPEGPSFDFLSNLRHPVYRGLVSYAHDAQSWVIAPEMEGVVWDLLFLYNAIDAVCPVCLAGHECIRRMATFSTNAYHYGQFRRHYEENEEKERRAREREERRRFERARSQDGVQDPWREERKRASLPKPPKAVSPEVLRAAQMLGISWPATKQVVVRAFRDAALKKHPDRGGSHDEMVRVSEARDVLLRQF